jgi:hypothetical protein
MTEAARQLEARLDSIHAALRAGRLCDLAVLTRALEESLGAADRFGATDLGRLRAKAARNAAALAAAGRGVRAAGRRLAEIRAVRDGFLAYGPTGERDETGGPGELAKRF